MRPPNFHTLAPRLTPPNTPPRVPLDTGGPATSLRQDRQTPGSKLIICYAPYTWPSVARIAAAVANIHCHPPADALSLPRFPEIAQPSPSFASSLSTALPGFLFASSSSTQPGSSYQISVTRSEEELSTTSTMAATKKPILPPLQTPKSASFPSDLLLKTPLSAVGSVIKQEEGINTPITPPSAYTDFLKALTPVLTSPPPLSAVPPLSGIPRSLSDSAVPTRSFAPSEDSSNTTTPISEPPSSKSFSFCKCEGVKSPHGANPTPPSPFAHPSQPARTPTSLRRLRIPQSPLHSAPLYTPHSAQSPMSATIARSPFSPADWNLDATGHRYFETPRSACVRPVSVRSVVTRTVTYKRTPLDPAPKGKKRKMDGPDMPPPPPNTAQTAVV